MSHASEVPKCTAPIELPEWLVDEYALREWNRLLPHLEPLGLLTVADSECYGKYCQTHADLRRCREEWEASGGMTVVGGNGGLKNHPAWIRWNSLMTHYRQLWKELGLSPTARAGLKIDPLDKADPLLEILRDAS